MQSYSYYSRTLLIEFLQRTIFFKIWKSLNKNYYWYFLLNNRNKLFITYNSQNWLSEAFIKFENRAKNDFLIHSMRITNNYHLEYFANLIDKALEEKSLKRWFLKINNNFDNLDFNLDL